MTGLTPSESHRELGMRERRAVENARELFEAVADDAGRRLPYLFTEGNMTDSREIRVEILIQRPGGEPFYSTKVRIPL